MLNRIARFASQFESVASQPVAARAVGGMIMVPAMAQTATWHAQFYQLAYQRALADLAPPAHHSRFFSCWN